MKRLLLLFFPLFFYSQSNTKIAFISDIHFQDLYGAALSKTNNNLKSHPKYLMRSMESQLRSTRIYNENYFALLKALDEIKDEGIKLVIFPGDFTDNGQPYNLRGLSKILQQYALKYNMRFLMTTGNHDPVRPFKQDWESNDFLDKHGHNYSVGSISKNNRQNYLLSQDFAEGGYEEILNEMHSFGFTPSEKDFFWETPFRHTVYEDYSFKEAVNDAKIDNRQYEVAPGYKIPNLTYVVEPVKGIWILAIDANTYIPTGIGADPKNPHSYNGAEDGYNNLMSANTNFFEWIKEISEDAKRHNKTLIAFTHYPVLDYNDGASKEITHLLGKGKWQMNRLPEDVIAKKMKDAGINLHFAGHMHINDTGVKYFPSGMLVNVQVPSLAAYKPAYKVLTIVTPNQFLVETKVVEQVPHFNRLFPFYKKEYAELQKSGARNIWNRDILKSKSYGEFMKIYLKELVRLRMIPEEWPKKFISDAGKLSGRQLLELSGAGKAVNVKEKNFTGWDFEDALVDLYRLWFADSLAMQDIPKERLTAYKILEDNFENSQDEGELVKQLKLFFSIMKKFSTGDPAENFTIDFVGKTVSPAR